LIKGSVELFHPPGGPRSPRVPSPWPREKSKRGGGERTVEKHLVAVVFNARQKAFVVVVVIVLLCGESFLTLSQSMEHLRRDNR